MCSLLFFVYLCRSHMLFVLVRSFLYFSFRLFPSWFLDEFFGVFCSGCVFFFFSSRRRHTSCALVTGVQTCALPIFTFDDVARAEGKDFTKAVATEIVALDGLRATIRTIPAEGEDKKVWATISVAFDPARARPDAGVKPEERSEERRVGKACVSQCQSRWSRDHSKKKKTRKI